MAHIFGYSYSQVANGRGRGLGRWQRLHRKYIDEINCRVIHCKATVPLAVRPSFRRQRSHEFTWRIRRRPPTSSWEDSHSTFQSLNWEKKSGHAVYDPAPTTLTDKLDSMLGRFRYPKDLRARKQNPLKTHSANNGPCVRKSTRPRDKTVRGGLQDQAYRTPCA